MLVSGGRKAIFNFANIRCTEDPTGKVIQEIEKKVRREVSQNRRQKIDGEIAEQKTILAVPRRPLLMLMFFLAANGRSAYFFTVMFSFARRS